MNELTKGYGLPNVGGVNNKKCPAPYSSVRNNEDLVRTRNLNATYLKELINTNSSGVKDSVNAFITEQCKKTVPAEKCCDVDACLEKAVKEIRDTSFGTNEWKCPKMFQSSGQCYIQWNCSISEWKDFCGNSMQFATTIASHCKPAFIASVIILSATIANDINEHLLIMRQVPLLWKVLKMAQILISVYICIVNSSNAAG